jgi:hypothetical protein
MILPQIGRSDNGIGEKNRSSTVFFATRVDRFAAWLRSEVLD